MPSAVAQVTTATLAAGNSPDAVAVNAMTNKTYVANYDDGTVTVIDGATNNTSTVTVGFYPDAIAVNPATNQIYVANYCGNDSSCNSAGTVTVINGATLNTTSVNVGYGSIAVAVNSTTNKIYVANYYDNTVTVIDANNNNATATVNVGNFPEDVEVNPATNQIYAVNNCGTDNTCNSAGTVTAIDANNNNNTSTVNVGYYPYYAAVNSATNLIYVTNNCGNDVNCESIGTVTVINGATNNTVSVNVGFFPYTLALNSTTNNIYVANNCGNDVNCGSLGTVTVIDGATNNTTNVNVGAFPYGSAVNAVTNKSYVVNYCGTDVTCKSAGTVTAIDGVTNNTVPIAVGDAPYAAAVNATTNNIYVPNYEDASVSVVGGSTTLQLVAVPPCRLVDTRPQNGGGGPIQGGTFETFNLPQLAKQSKGCPTLDLSTAATYSLNVTVAPPGSLGYLTIWPAGQIQPLVSTLNSPDGRVKANAAIVPAGANGAVSVYVSDTSNVVLDIDGYFAPAGKSTLAFYPLTPCRVADTRKNNFPSGLGAPSLPGGVQRDFPILNTTCPGIPANVQGYSFNFTAVPKNGQPLGYLTVWPAGQMRPVVSTLNAPTGTVVANAAIVPAGTGGDIEAYASDNTDLLIDINGYFDTPGQNGLSLYPTAPCRVIDTRKGSGAFEGELTVDVVDSVCGPPSAAQAYVFNATVVPSGSLGYLTLWADGTSQPVVSTLNAQDGAVTSNMAIVPNSDGSTDAYASDLTQLILDISSYFANPTNLASPAIRTRGPQRLQRTGRPIPKR